MKQHLIIEGHDSWVLGELLEKHLPTPKGYSSKESLKEFFKAANGFDNVPRLISAILKIEGLTNLGIIVDANTKGAKSRWDVVKNRLNAVFSNDLLKKYAPKVGGIVVKEEGYPTVGVWIMPDNQSEGYLERFLAGMIPPKDKEPLWNHTQHTLSELQKQSFCEFSEISYQKALVRTWLAWQKEPGLSYGLALRKGYFDDKVDAVKPFIEWIANTFELEAAAN